jgi:catechol 2,3-dioxygenase-like lactoylglutathione lyase family enzyme
LNRPADKEGQVRGMFNHVDLRVPDPERSLAFHEAVLGYMGYRRAATHERGFDFDREAAGGVRSSAGGMGAEGGGKRRRHDRYSPGCTISRGQRSIATTWTAFIGRPLKSAPKSLIGRPTMPNTAKAIAPCSLPIRTASSSNSSIGQPRH